MEIINNILDVLIKQLGILIPSLIGISIATWQLIVRHRFEIRKYNDEKKFRQLQDGWVREQFTRISRIGDQIAYHITEELKKDVNWAITALDKARIGPQSRTLFGIRSSHFHAEKELLAKEFSKLLLLRCRNLLQGKTVNAISILIDSGTTLFPFFEAFAREIVKGSENGELWIKNIRIITNNLPGIMTLMDAGRLNPNNRYSPMVVNAAVLPGEPLPIYAAVTGEETKGALDWLRRTKPDDTVFIALTTGNWLFIPKGNDKYPVPLARGPYHKDIKQKLFDHCDEVYVVAPLGKIFLNQDKKSVNDALGFDNQYKDPDRTEYEEINISPANVNKVKLVTTQRRDQSILYPLSIRLTQEMGKIDFGRTDNFIKNKIENVNHIMLPFDKVDSDPYQQKKIEFPHAHTQSVDFTHDYFFVDLT